MAEPGHCNAFVRRPAPSSLYGFLLAGYQRLEAEAPFPVAPLDAEKLPQLGPKWVAEHNERFLQFEAILRNRARKDLAALGLSDEQLNQPAARDRVEHMVIMERWLLAFALDRAPRAAPLAPQHTLVIGASAIVFGKPFDRGRSGFRNVADVLNTDLASGEYGLTRDHVRREWTRLLVAICSARSEYGEAAFHCAINQVRALKHVYDEACRHPDFRHLTGSALWDLISVLRNPVRVLERAYDALERQGRLLQIDLPGRVRANDTPARPVDSRTTSIDVPRLHAADAR